MGEGDEKITSAGVAPGGVRRVSAPQKYAAPRYQRMRRGVQSCDASMSACTLRGGVNLIGADAVCTLKSALRTRSDKEIERLSHKEVENLR